MEKRDLVANLILLCNKCHKIIDDLVESFPVDLLRAKKAEHEQWVKETLGQGDPIKRKDDLVYASYVDEWAKRADIDNWLDWSYSMLSQGSPRMSTKRVNGWKLSSLGC